MTARLAPWVPLSPPMWCCPDPPAIMGRKLDLSKLTDEEAKHVWEVVQRDFDLRKKEEERLEELKGKIQKESRKKELLSDQAHLNQTHCGHCLQPYHFLVNSRRQCLDCLLYTCKKCGSYHRREQGWVCDPCQLARVVKTGSLDWYYEHVRARFKHFGSAKVMRSLCGRLPHEHGSSPALGEAQLSPVGGSGESELTSENESLDGAKAQHLGREKRLLSVDPFDFEVDSDCSAQSCPQSLQLSPAPATLDSLQTLSDAPCADNKAAASQKDGLITDANHSPEAQHLLQERERSGPEISLPSDSSLERKPSPEGEAMKSDQPQVPDFAGMDTSNKDGEEAHQMAARLPHHASQENTAPPESQPHTDADIEEETLKRKLGELTSKVSDKGGSSEEEEESQSGLSPRRSSVPGTWPAEVQQADQTHGGDSSILDLEVGGPHTRSPEAVLSKLEDRAALTATEVQHAKREVSDIKTRIAALSAAGLPVKTWEKPRKKSNLLIFPLQPPKNSLKDEDPELTGANKVMARPHVQRRILNNSLKLQDRVDSPFSRKSASRGSLTQRNPNGKNRRVDHIFAKPVMTHQP
ncbi:melanophilin isoform X2 [Petaurus breviceps papuanus]|uniref:melanophilin isoform X2 n=1 Tax=Petaurus breviceps papuanus TaxID=3040969 RepID=UPI0036DCC865